MWTAAAIALAWYALLSLATLAMFWMDKRRAARNAWRVPERTLHTMSALGGWPGAIAGMRWVRHKNRKPAFVAITAGIVLVHAAIWGVVIWTAANRS